MSETPLVSIILPTFNRAHLLPRAVNSVLHQSYTNWELLIWNDGSSDETEAILRSFTDPRIRYFSEPNHGKPYALNHAFSYSNGDLIAFLDDDDQWLPGKLALQVSFLNDNPEVDLIFGNYRNVDKATNQEKDGFAQSAAGLASLQTASASFNFKQITGGWLENLAMDNFIAMDTVVLRKDLMEKTGKFNENLCCAEDFEFWWRAGLAGYRFAYTDEILLIRNKYPGSLSTSSVRTLTGTLHTLDACAEASRRAGREETIQFLRPTYRNLWQNLITAYGLKGDLPLAFKAFTKANHYGLQLGSFSTLLGAFYATVKRKEK